MKKIVLLVLTVAFVVSCQESKIGYVDNGIVINDYQAKKDVETKYQAKEKAYNQKQDSIEKAFQIEAQKFQLAANKMSQKKAQERYQELGQQRQIIDQQRQNEANQLAQAYQNEIDTLIVRVKDYVKGYGEKNGYTFILGTSEGSASVLYGKEETDLTQTILDALNEEYKNKK